MYYSVAELFKIGIGPSSSHTVGPMWAGYRFIEQVALTLDLNNLTHLEVELYGSLAFTGKGHATNSAVLLGLAGHTPNTIDPSLVDSLFNRIVQDKELRIQGRYAVKFDYDKDLIWNFKHQLPYHSNGMRFKASDGKTIIEKYYYSIGGGSIMAHDDINKPVGEGGVQFAYPFNNAKELVAICKREGLTIAQVALKNELSFRTEQETLDLVDNLAAIMQGCIQRGIKNKGILPGGLNLKRRANDLYEKIRHREGTAESEGHHFDFMDWVNLYALAVNEENAGGGRVVTAPTNGGAGVVPAVLEYYRRFIKESDQAGTRNFLLTASAIGSLYKLNASISAAEMGCQGEVGVACSMAAAALTAALNGSVDQVINAAEIGMEHNLGLTCDPIGGLVQIPCIERNTMGAIKAINASRLALRGDGTHYVSLDAVIQTMFQTGKDMNAIYKETSLGGLAVAVNKPSC